MGNVSKTILVGVDDTDQSDIAITEGFRLAKAMGGKAHFCQVVAEPIAMMPMVPGWTFRYPHDWDRVVKTVEQRLKLRLEKLSAGQTFHTEVRTGSTRATLAALTNDLKPSVVVLGAHEPTLMARLLGSTCRHMVRHAEADIYVARKLMIPDEAPIVCAVDLSEARQNLLEWVANAAKLYGHPVVLVHSIDIPRGMPEAMEPGWAVPGNAIPDAVLLATNLLTEDLARWPFPEGSRVVVTVGKPADNIIKAATDAGATTIVLGTHSRTGLTRAFWGSVSERVATESDCNIWILHPYGGGK